MKHSVLVVLLLALACPFAQAETQDRQKPIEIQADHFFGDEVKQVATYTGSVRVDQGTMRLTGQKLVLQETSTGYKNTASRSFGVIIINGIAGHRDISS